MHSCGEMRFNLQPVWIHGGGLVVGEASDYNGSKLAFQGKVVVGNITGGSIDVNRNRAPSVRIGGVTGTYALDSKLLGSMSLTTASGFDHPPVVSFALASDGKSGRIADSTPDGLVVSGQLLRQDRIAFSLAKIWSDFVFKLENTLTIADRVACDPLMVTRNGRIELGKSSAFGNLARCRWNSLEPYRKSKVSKLTESKDESARLPAYW